MNKAQQDIRRKKRVLEHAARIGNVRKTCRYFGVARSGFYVWKKAYETQVMRAWSTRSRARTTHGSARPPPSSRRSFISAARITSAPSASFGISSAITASRFRKPGSTASSGATA